MTSYDYRSLRSRTRLLRGLLFFLVAIDLARMAAHHHERAVLHNVEAMTAETRDLVVASAHQSDAIVGMLAVIFILVLLSTYVVAGTWLYRAHANLRAQGVKRLNFTPGWCVGWYCVPFANLVMPYRSMAEIWQASLDGLNWNPDAPAPTLRIWWGLWLAGAFTGYLAGAWTRGASDLPALLQANAMQLAACVLNLAVTLVFAHVVGEVAHRQARQFEAPPAGQAMLEPA